MSVSQSQKLGASDASVDLSAMEALPMGPDAVCFEFTYRGTRFTVRAHDRGDGSAALNVSADLGHMPFSAEAPAARSGLSAIILHGNGLLGRVFTLVDERIILGGELTVVTPVTASHLLTALAKFLIPASPYMDLIATYFEPGSSRLRIEWRKPARPSAPPRALRSF